MSDSSPAQAPLPQKITLTREEQLELQLLQSQKEVIQERAQRQFESLDTQMGNFAARISKRLGGIDVLRYNINPLTGVGTLIPEQPGAVDQASPQDSGQAS